MKMLLAFLIGFLLTGCLSGGLAEDEESVATSEEPLCYYGMPYNACCTGKVDAPYSDGRYGNMCRAEDDFISSSIWYWAGKNKEPYETDGCVCLTSETADCYMTKTIDFSRTASPRYQTLKATRGLTGNNFMHYYISDLSRCNFRAKRCSLCPTEYIWN